MKHLFVSYELAKPAKEKGFNEPCVPRREIIKHITGQYLPLSKCGYYAAVNALTNYFNQQTLF